MSKLRHKWGTETTGISGALFAECEHCGCHRIKSRKRFAGIFRFVVSYRMSMYRRPTKHAPTCDQGRLL